MRSRTPIILFSFFLFLSVFVFSARPGLELVVVPVWIRPVDGHADATSAARESLVHAFRHGGRYGYVDAFGNLLVSEAVTHDVALSPEFAVSYSAVSARLLATGPDGKVAFTVDTRSYPFFSGGRNFLISTNRAALREIDDAGTTLWSREYSSVITCVDATSSAVAVGLLDGRLQVLDGAGVPRWEHLFSDSRIQAVYGCALSEAGALAVVHGLGPQWLSVYIPQNGALRPHLAVRLDTEARRRRNLGFSADGRSLFVEDEAAVLILDLSTKRRRQERAPGVWAAFHAFGEMSLLAHRSDDGTTLSFLSRNGDVAASAAYDDADVSVSAGPGYLVIGAERLLGRVDARYR